MNPQKERIGEMLAPPSLKVKSAMRELNGIETKSTITLCPNSTGVHNTVGVNTLRADKNEVEWGRKVTLSVSWRVGFPHVDGTKVSIISSYFSFMFAS
jgi:hypothetical protein